MFFANYPTVVRRLRKLLVELGPFPAIGLLYVGKRIETVQVTTFSAGASQAAGVEAALLLCDSLTFRHFLVSLPLSP